MGAPNVDSWLPGAHSIIRVDEFKSPKELVDYLLTVNKDPSLYEQYFQWKNSELPPSFVAKLENCALANLGCRLCEEVSNRVCDLFCAC